jgi:hypothetical protein
MEYLELATGEFCQLRYILTTSPRQGMARGLEVEASEDQYHYANSGDDLTDGNYEVKHIFSSSQGPDCGATPA